jgi:hypothetical protein
VFLSFCFRVLYLLKLRRLLLGVHMAAIISQQLVSSMTQRARALIDQFQLDQAQCPARAWEPLAELRELLGELTLMFPARAFRRRRIQGAEG